MIKADYIDRNKIPWYRENFKERCHNDVWTETRTITYKSDVDNIPSADVVERKIGEWIEDGYYNELCVCSYCAVPGDPVWNFCPNCGAKMKKGDCYE